MKKLLTLSMLIPLAMVCSCQKQDASMEQQLAQRKAELDTRAKALDDREKALAAREKAIARAALMPGAQLRSLKKDGSSAASTSATVPPGLAPPDNSELKASRQKRIEELRALRQRRIEAIRQTRSMKQPNAGPGAAVDTSGSPSSAGSAETSTSTDSAAEAASPSPSVTPQ
jgi:hypothetical protein